MGRSLAHEGWEAYFDQVNSLDSPSLSILSRSGSKIDYGSVIQADQIFPLERW